jgi:catechol 2,3-dioxygenase
MIDAVRATPTEEFAPSVGVAPPGFRLPANARLGEVWLEVADLGQSVEYYRTVLGMHLFDRQGDDASIATLGSSDGTPLVRLHERPGVAPVPQQGVLGLYHFAILLPDRPALGRFIAHLAELEVRVGASDHLVSEALYLRDPDGLGIEVYADRPRSSWQSSDGQIHMTTEPLDLRAIVAAAGVERWTGMPAGTRMGHVHLTVADLEQASRFYHAALGLDRMAWSYPGALFLAAGGYHHHLGLNTWAGARARPAGKADARLLEWRVVLPSSDADAARASMDEAGYGTFTTNDGWRTIDPWGTTLRVVSERTA